MRNVAIGAATLVFAALAVQLIFETRAQQPSPSSTTLGLERGAYAVGFQRIEEEDPSRVVDGGVSSAARPRPVRVYLWYPGGGADTPIRFGRYAELADADIWPPEIAAGARDLLRYSRGPLARSLARATFDALLQRPMRATENVRPQAGPFPLIVIGQGLYYESPVAFAAMSEFLAGRGFVVATAPLVGTNSPLVRNDAQDLETQVRDLEFVIARARALPFVSPDSLGVLGFDQGGMAGVILAMRNPDVDAFASLDSGILYPHPSGLPQALPSYDPRALRVPWLHATSPRGVAPPPDSSVRSLFDTAVHSNRYLLVTEGMNHVDFTSYALIEDRRAIGPVYEPGSPVGAARHRVVAEYVADFFEAFLRRDAESLARFARDPREAFPEAAMTLEHRTAAPPSIGYDAVVQAVLTGNAEQAVATLRASDAAERGALDEAHLVRLAVSLLYTWGLAKEALPIVELAAEQYPDSVQAQGTLVEAYVLTENYPAAIEVLSRFLEQHPENAGARARLDQVRKLENDSRR